ncbi:MAG: CHAD domain-containing protein [Methyloprofundus sp.]|nr:CHAD domain-containing protein [Methyloprofundus sp.]MBW6453455.1 CHAD domain-containing protein [Methyloprofundus sp.]
MTAHPLYFELPEHIAAEKFLSKLSKKINFQIVSEQYAIKTFYDSFDWRLYTANILCELNQSKTASHISLIDRNSGECLALESQQDVPSFSHQFQEGRLKTKLDPLLDMRALLPLCQLPHQVYQINVLNKDQKTIVRIKLEKYEGLGSRISLQPLKGYEKAMDRVSVLLEKSLALAPTQSSILNSALKLQGRKAKDYSSKLAIQLDPELRADHASKIIYRDLLKAIKTNEAGTIADTDTEFLHDYRVAVRRTRAGLSQIKHVFPDKVVAKHASFFAWLGQITGATRDLDVYLLNYKQYKAALPESLQDALVPLYTFLKQKQKQAQTELANQLKSPNYIKQLLAWEQYLKAPLPKKGCSSAANLSIKALADQRIWKVYKRLIKQAEAITEHSPAEALHELRKTCKKLRYLMEFFQSLYPADEVKELIKALKGFQSVLGDFQDYEVQENSLKRFSEEMMTNKVEANTFLAMGVLVQYLDTMRNAARHDFSTQYALFKQEQNRIAFKSLFAPQAEVKKS